MLKTRLPVWIVLTLVLVLILAAQTGCCPSWTAVRQEAISVAATVVATASMPTAAPQPAASPSPPTAQFAPLPPLGPVEPGWHEYESLARHFTLRYPDTWQIANEDKWSVTFDLGDFTMARFAVGPAWCKEDGGASEEEIINCLVLDVREQIKPDETFKLVSREPWDDEGWHGYLVEANVTWPMDGGDTATDYRCWMAVPLGPGVSLVTWLDRIGRDDVTEGVWRDFIKVVKSLRPLPQP